MFSVVSWLWLFALTIIAGPTERDLYALCKANIAWYFTNPSNARSCQKYRQVERSLSQVHR